MVNSGVDFCVLRDTEISAFLERGSFQAMVCVDARVGIRGGKIKTLAWSIGVTVNEIKTPTWAESSGPMMGHLVLDSLHSSIVRLTEPRSLLTLRSKGYAKL